MLPRLLFFFPSSLVGFGFFFNSIQHSQASAQRCFSKEQPGNGDKSHSLSPGSRGDASGTREKVHSGCSCERSGHPQLGESRGMRRDEQLEASSHGESHGHRLPSSAARRGLMVGCSLIYFIYFFKVFKPCQPLWASCSFSFARRAAMAQRRFARTDRQTDPAVMPHPQTSPGRRCCKAAPEDATATTLCSSMGDSGGHH